MNYTIFDMKYVYITVFALFLVLIVNVGSYAQCNLKFEYKVEHSEDGKNNGKIFLKRIDGEGPYVIRLYDMFGGKNEFIENKEYTTFNEGEFVLVFKDMKPSTYLIRVENSHCKRSVSDFEGIQVK